MSEADSKPITTDSPIPVLLDAVFAHYRALFGNENVGLYRHVARQVSAESPRNWSWRYLVSVHNGTLSASRFLEEAIRKHWASLQGEAPYVPAHACKVCGAAPTVCLCDGKKVVKTRPRKYKDLFSMPAKTLLDALENRMEF